MHRYPQNKVLRNEIKTYWMTLCTWKHYRINLLVLFGFFLCLLFCRTSAAHIIVQFTLKLLDKTLPSLSESEVTPSLCGAFIFVCRQIYNTYEGLQVLRTYGLHKALAAAWKKVPVPHLRLQSSFMDSPLISGTHRPFLLHKLIVIVYPLSNHIWST